MLRLPPSESGPSFYWSPMLALCLYIFPVSRGFEAIILMPGKLLKSIVLGVEEAQGVHQSV